jgi:hypothetical protein
MNPELQGELDRLRRERDELRKERDDYRSDAEQLRARLNDRDSRQLETIQNTASEAVKQSVWGWMRKWGAILTALIAIATAGGVIQVREYVLDTVKKKVGEAVDKSVQAQIKDSTEKIDKLEADVDIVRANLIETISNFKADARNAALDIEREKKGVIQHASETRAAITAQLAQSVSSAAESEETTVTTTAPPGAGNDVWFGTIPKNVVGIAASKADQHALDAPTGGIKMGFFSWHFQKALTTESSDRNDDGVIAWREAVDVAAQAMRSEAVGGAEQTPVIEGEYIGHGIFASAPGKAPARHRKIRALLIGINKYASEEGMFDLQGAVNDVEGFATLLGNKTRRLSDELELTSLTDQNASTVRIKAAVSEIVRSSQAGEVCLIYYSGHILTEKSPESKERLAKALVPHDFDTKKFQGIFVSDIVRELGQAKAECVIIIDG